MIQDENIRKEKIRVLFILADLETGGAQKVILTILNFLNQERFDIHLAIIQSGGPLNCEIPENIRVYDLNIRRVRYSPPALLRLCWSLKPDYVISTLGHLNLALLFIQSFLPPETKLIIREANTASMRLRYTRFPALYRVLYRILYPRAHLIFANSLSMKNDMVKTFDIPAYKIVVTGNPVDIERINQAAQAVQNPYCSVGYQLAAVGRLTHQKGFDLLIKTLSFCLSKRGDINLMIVGEGPERSALEKMVDLLDLRDHVTFAGHQDNPYSFMFHADLLISSSRWEGLPNVVLESLACGTPVIAFDCPGGTREIIEDGKNGWLIPLDDWEAMGKKIIWVLDHLKHLALDKDMFLPKPYHLETVVNIYENHFR